MPEWSSYNYGYCNPITWTDPTGMQPDENWHPPMQKMGPAELSFSNGVPEMQHGGGALDGVEVIPSQEKDNKRSLNFELSINVTLPEISLGFGRPAGHFFDLSKKDEGASSESLSPFVRKMLDKIHKTEGEYVDNPKDPGGKTKYGIAETREWKAFAKFFGINPDPNNIQNITSEQADKYYLQTRFKNFGIDKIKSEKIANAVFDQSVITPGIVKGNMMKALNDLGYNFDYKLGIKTPIPDDMMKAINSVNPDQFVEKFAARQLSHYEGIKQTNPANYNEHIRGWRNRLETLKKYR